MALNELEPDKPYVGLLVEEGTDSNGVGAALVFTRKRGAEVTVPYNTDYSKISSGAVYSTGPRIRVGVRTKTAVMRLHDGDVWLFETSSTGDVQRIGGSGVSERRLTARVVVVGYNELGSLEEPLLIGSVTSDIDGLSSWTGFALYRITPVQGADGKITEVSLSTPPSQSTEWEHNGARFRLSNNWTTTSSLERSEATLRGRVELISTFAERRPLAEHIKEQRRLTVLLTLLYGFPIRFRRHSVSDAGFTSDHKWALSAETYEDQFHPKPEQKALNDCIATLKDIGPDGLQKWWSLSETWVRVVGPTFSLLRRESPAVEDSVVNTCITLEGMGHLIGPVQGEDVTYNGRQRGDRTTTATQIFRCLTSVGFKWSGIAESLSGLATAMGTTYNHVKHLKNDRYPDVFHMYLVAKISLLTVRFNIAKLLVQDPNWSAPDSPAGQHLIDAEQSLQGLPFRISNDGVFEAREQDGSQSPA